MITITAQQDLASAGSMRRPTPVAVLHAWHSAALRGLSPANDGTPRCGWYKRRLVRGGVFVPARIWMVQDICPETGELLSDEVLRCEVNGIAADPEEALRLANDSEFGLQGALFTRSLKWAMRFSEEFEVGSLWVNEASRFRLDMYPFGGAKRSGFGREGVRYAIEELSQLRFTGMRFDV